MVDAGDSVGDGPSGTDRSNGRNLHDFSCDSIGRYRIKGHGHRGDDRINDGHHVIRSDALDSPIRF